MAPNKSPRDSRGRFLPGHHGHMVRDRHGRFRGNRDPNGELILPREYWDRPNRDKMPDKRA